MLFIGHSHMVCVLNAAQEAGMAFRAVTLKGVKKPAHASGLNLANLIEDTGKPALKRVIQAMRDAGATLTYLLATPAADADHTQARSRSAEHGDERPGRRVPVLRRLLERP